MRVLRREFLARMGAGLSGVMAGRVLGASDQRSAWPPAAELDDDAFWQQVRRQYPLTRDRVYLNTGGLGPAPFAVIDTVQQSMMDLQRISEHGHRRIQAVRGKSSTICWC